MEEPRGPHVEVEVERCAHPSKKEVAARRGVVALAPGHHPPEPQRRSQWVLSEGTGRRKRDQRLSQTRMLRYWRRLLPLSTRRDAQAADGEQNVRQAGGRVDHRREGLVDGHDPARAATRRCTRRRERGSGGQLRMRRQTTRDGCGRMVARTPPPPDGGEGCELRRGRPPGVGSGQGEKYPPCQGRSTP